jgi:hypothetical protein
LLRGLFTDIDPGDSLKEVRVIADNVLASEHYSLTGRTYVPGSHVTSCIAFPIEQGNTFSSKILVRQAFFAPSNNGPLEQTSALMGAMYYCRLFHLTWQRRGYIYRQSPDPYAHDLFVICEQIHNEYAVARLKNILLSQHFSLQIEATGQIAPFFTQYGAALATLFDQVPSQLQACGILQLAPLLRKDAILPTAYRFIFEPLARHAGFLAPIPSDYPGLMVDNMPEKNAFYRETIAPYWISIKSTLETSFDSQFSKTEEELQMISETMDAFLSKLGEINQKSVSQE